MYDSNFGPLHWCRPVHLFLLLRVVGPAALCQASGPRTFWTFCHADARARLLTLNCFSLELNHLDDPLRRWANQPGSYLANWDLVCRDSMDRVSGDAAHSARAAYASMQYFLEHRSRTGRIITSRLPARLQGYGPSSAAHL